MSLLETVEAHQTDLALKWTRVQGGEVFEDDELVVTIVGLPVSFTNNVHRSRLSSASVERRVAETAALLRERGVPALWWIGPLDTPEELPDVVQRNGLRHAEDMPWLAADLDAIADTPMPPEIEAHRAATPELFDRFVKAMMLGFGDDAGAENAMRSLRASVMRLTRWTRHASKACVSIRSFASVLIGVRWAAAASHVAPISTTSGRSGPR